MNTLVPKELAPSIDWRDWLAKFKQNCKQYPKEFVEQDKPVRKDPLDTLTLALKQARLL